MKKRLTRNSLPPTPMNTLLIELLIFAIIAVVWQYIPVPEPIKLIGWVILGVAFIIKFLIPLLS